ncbi:F0F1-type ATP synthase membrane subunit b/b' [Streptomyces albogriseolus]|uniref:F0F1-type ATP synthase membrane subunit b/b n=1 Tax=Streptomyces albogriseolus TaxID=1887 RepID=A0ACC6UI13_STRAO
MSRALPKYNKRRVGLAGGAAAVALTGAVIAGTALAGESSDGGGADARTLAGPGTISCPDVASQLPAVPASAQAEVTRNLALLDQQIAEANKRLVDTVGQGGPNFVQNAILGPLEDKRIATVNRIATAIGRTADRPAGLDSLAACSLDAQGDPAAPGQEETGGAGTAAPPAEDAGGDTGAGGGDAGAGQGGDASGAGTISCPDVASQLPAVPASAQAEVTRNLALLDQQIAEANKRLVDTVGQGGPNFVQNAILGPLEDKRIATVNRIATAIGRTADRPAGLDSLAACSLDAQGDPAAPGQEETGGAGTAAPPAEDAGGDTGAGGGDAGAGQGGDASGAGTISCPDVASQLPAVPASAQAEVTRNLALLDQQIAEANKRLVDTVGQGGPNFVQNAILGPLEDKRIATVNRIATAIGRTADRPAGLDSLAACTLTK